MRKTPLTAGGRPTTYKLEYCEKAKELGREGAGRYKMAAELGCAYSTMQEWEKEHPEFKAAMEEAGDLSHAWWEEQGRKGIWAGTQFNASAYALQVKSRFPSAWRDGQTSVGGITINITPDEAKV
jgi:hypothetical protein